MKKYQTLIGPNGPRNSLIIFHTEMFRHLYITYFKLIGRRSEKFTCLNFSKIRAFSKRSTFLALTLFPAYYGVCGTKSSFLYFIFILFGSLKEGKIDQL